MSLFGEINLPSSRALYDEDDEENTRDESSRPLIWDIDNCLPKKKFDCLLIVESPKLTKVAEVCLLSKGKKICHIVDINLSIYKISERKYVVLYTENEINNSCIGQIVEMLVPWIKQSDQIIALNSQPSATYQCNSNEDRPTTFLRSLSTGKVPTFSTKLEAPNLAIGLSAGVLSYCHHSGLPASLYICYMEPTQLDSISVQPIVDLFKKLKIENVKPYKINIIDSDSFLYM